MRFIEKTCSIIVVKGIEIPGIHFQDQKYSNETTLTITELIKLITQNKHLMNHIKQVESGINRKLRGISRGNLNGR
jgi:hypothetical protein